MRTRVVFFTCTLVAVIAVTCLTSAQGALASVPSERWRPSEETVYDGWALLSNGATYQPCETVQWHFDRRGETEDRSTMIDDIRAGLALLEAPSGLKFVEAPSKARATLTFKWGDLSEGGGDVAGRGGGSDGKGSVTFSNTSIGTVNERAGAGYINVPDLENGLQYETDGRQTVVIHEVMHAMGFGHVSDPSSIMFPMAYNGTTFSAGDLAGLRTMYLDNPCPQGRVCMTVHGMKPKCEAGSTWTYSRCWNTHVKSALVQELRGKRWVTVQKVPVKRSTNCYSRYPYLIDFAQLTERKGTTRYRVAIGRGSFAITIKRSANAP